MPEKVSLHPMENQSRRGRCPTRFGLHRRWPPLPRGVWIVFLMTLLGLPWPVSADVTADFAQANVLYELGKYSEAAAAYAKIVQTGQVTPALYFNLGNAWFKSGHLGLAIAAYQQAEALSPREPDIAANLRFARDSVAGTSSLPGNRMLRWLRRLTLNEWAGWAGAATWLWFILLILGQGRPEWRRLLRDYARAAGVIACLFLIACGATFWDRDRVVRAVVIVPEAVVRHGPLTESQSYYSLHDGAEITVQDRQGEWLQVIDSAKRLGWLCRDHALLLTNLWGLPSPQH
jgi:tetratricopeptide (TPR) repeat protein